MPIEKIMPDIPPTYKIEFAAKNLHRHIDNHKTLVVLGGYGAWRDWNYGIRKIFKNYNPNLGLTYALNQDDREQYGIRPIINDSLLNDLKKYYIYALVFDTSIKSKDSPSYLGQLLSVILNTDTIIFTSATYDYYGRTHFPIEPKFIKMGIEYSGPKKLLLENKKKVEQFIRSRKFINKKSRDRAERMLYDFESYLEERIGELQTVQDIKDNLVRVLVT